MFLDGNNLTARWAELSPGNTFVIGEIGFGTGMNFMAAWRLWRRLAPACRLHFFSFEKFPLSNADMRRVHALWPELMVESNALCAQYGPLAPGWHRYLFDDAAVVLTLVIGDARTCLPRFKGCADAWFLDGFAPAKNPQLWEPALLSEVAARSRAGTTLATYSSAGQVRRDLQSSGFAMLKRRGHGHKREMLVGHFERAHAGGQAPVGPGRAVVVGGGVAGCASARALAQRGWSVDILEQGATLASGASALPQASIHLRWARRPLPAHRLALAGYQHSIRLFRGAQGDWSGCGTLQVDAASRRPWTEVNQTDSEFPFALARRVDSVEASDLAGISMDSGGTYFPLGGWVRGFELCSTLARHARIHIHMGTRVVRLDRVSPSQAWSVRSDTGLLWQPDLVVVANAFDASKLDLLAGIPLHRVGGQVTRLRAGATSANLRVVLCGESILTPVLDGWHSLGATYNHSRADLIPSDAEHAENWAGLTTLSAGLVRSIGPESLASAQSFVAFRTTAPDRTPVAGLHPSWPGLAFNLAHGSRGFSTAPLLAEHLASQLSGEPWPLPVELDQAVFPGRFAVGR